MKNLLKILVNSFFIFIVLTFTLSGIYLFNIAKKTTYFSVEKIKNIPSSVILDSNNNIVKTFLLHATHPSSILLTPTSTASTWNNP